MKKIVSISVLTFLFFLSLVFVKAQPVEAGNPTFFEGFVAEQTSVGDFIPVDGATINADCVHAGVHTHKTAVSDMSGSYSIEFADTECANGDHVTATAQKGNFIGTAEGDIFDRFGGAFIIMTSQAAVPEFGTVTALTAGLVAAGYMLTIRRKAHVTS